MSKARHEKGGFDRWEHVGKEHLDKEEKPKLYNAQGSEESKEAEKGHDETERKHGGRLKRKHGGKIEGEHSKKRLDRPGRKRGGSVGADRMPLTTAAKVTDATGHKTDDGNSEDE